MSAPGALYRLLDAGNLSTSASLGMPRQPLSSHWVVRRVCCLAVRSFSFYVTACGQQLLAGR